MFTYSLFSFSVPDPPDLKISGETNVSITVQWKMPDSYRGPDPTYKLRWTQSKKISITEIDRASREDEHTENDLEPFTLYQVQIQALNEAGAGKWSENVEAKTQTGSKILVYTVKKLLFKVKAYINAK